MALRIFGLVSPSCFSPHPDVPNHCLSALCDGNVLNRYGLIASAANALQREHAILERAHESSGRVRTARRLYGVACLYPLMAQFGEIIVIRCATANW